MGARGLRAVALPLAGVVAIALQGCQKQTIDTSTPASSRAVSGKFGDPAALQQDDGQWVMPAKNYASTRFSGLNEINTENVRQLGVSWTFSTGMVAGHEAAPLVVGDTMYIVTPFPNILYALDLKKNGAVKWKFQPEPAAAAQGVACCDVVNRGCFFDNGKIFFNTLDDNVCAVDAASGKLAWKTK